MRASGSSRFWANREPRRVEKSGFFALRPDKSGIEYAL
jgi:hypothetical protein